MANVKEMLTAWTEEYKRDVRAAVYKLWIAHCRRELMKEHLD